MTSTETGPEPGLAELLADVADTGKPLTAEDLKSLTFRRGSAQERSDARRRIIHHSRQIAAAVRDGDRQAALNIAQETTEKYRNLLDAEVRPPWEGLLGNRPTGTTHRAAGHLPTRREVDALPLREDASAEDASTWRDSIHAQAARIAHLHGQGSLADARRLAKEATADLSGMLPGVEARDVNHDDLSPAELAALIPR